MSDKVGKIIDQYSFLDYKDAFSEMKVGGVGVLQSGNAAYPMPNGWVGSENWRRCTAYTLLESYYRNSGRAWMNRDSDEEDRLERREYGDPFLVVETVLSSVLGNDQSLFIQEAVAAEKGTNDPPSAQLDKLKEWADKEKFLLLMNECERDTVKLGDGVYVLGWDEDDKRPHLRVYNPGFYFPVLNERSLDKNGWPTKVHIAYEFDEIVGDKKKTFVRRITWEIKDLPNGAKVKYKWAPDKATSKTCYFTDGIWELNDINEGPLQDFSDANGQFTAQNKNLNLDFIPVVHIPHFAAGTEHFGISALSPLLQIFDDIQACDTDLTLSAATTGSPPLAVHGTTMQKDEKGRLPNYGPRTLLETGEGGAQLLSTANSLDALLKFREELNDILSVNGRVPKTLMGRVDPSKVPSGIVLTLSFSPHSGLIRHLRLIRKDKYSMLLRFVSRMYMADGQLEEIFEAEVKFGSYLPADKQEAITMVTAAVTAHVISLDTAVLMLIEAGIPIEDATEEIAKIIKEDFKAADDLVTATGDVQAARDRLGMGPAPQPTDLGGQGNAPPDGGLPNPNPTNVPPTGGPPFPSQQ